METLNGVGQQRRAIGKPRRNGMSNHHQNSPRKKPIKVVYISTPMRVETSASRFRALVQELTGRDAPDLPDPAMLLDSETRARAGEQTAAPNAAVDERSEKEMEDPLMEMSGLSFEPVEDDDDDDVFMPLMMDNFGGSLPANWVYETAQIDVLRSFCN